MSKNYGSKASNGNLGQSRNSFAQFVLKSSVLTITTVSLFWGCAESKNKAQPVNKTTKSAGESNPNKNSDGNQNGNSTPNKGQTPLNQDLNPNIKPKSSDVIPLPPPNSGNDINPNNQQIRKYAWNNLLSAGDMNAKAKQALVYVSNFDFFKTQKNRSFSGEHERSQLLQQTVQDLLAELSTIAPDSSKVNIFAIPDPQYPMSDDNRFASFNAVALTLGAQEISIKENSLDISLEGFIAKSLAPTKNNTQTGASAEILLRKPLSSQLLQTRYNYLIWMFLNKVTNYTEISENSYFPYENWRKSMWSWELNLDKYDVHQLETFLSSYLEPASITRRHLIAVAGIRPMYNSKVASLLSGLKIKYSPSKSESLLVSRGRIAQIIYNLQKDFK